MIGLLAGLAARSMGASRLAAFAIGRGVSAESNKEGQPDNQQPTPANPTISDVTGEVK